MTATKKKLLDLIKSQRDVKKEKKFEGTVLDYMEHVKDNPDTVKTSHKRL
jgi:serine protein kinase